MQRIIPIIPSADLYIDRSQEALDHFNYTKAIHCLKLALTMRPDVSQRVYIVSQMALIYENQGQYIQAVHMWQTLSPRTYALCPELIYFKAAAYALAGDPQNSYRYVNQYLQSGQRDYFQEALNLRLNLAFRTPKEF